MVQNNLDVVSNVVIDDSYTIYPRHKVFIATLLKYDPPRFKNVDEIITRAIDYFLTWELTPAQSINKMSENPLTVEQFVMIIRAGISLEFLNQFGRDYPNEFGEKWQEHCKKHPEDERAYNKSLEPKPVSDSLSILDPANIGSQKIDLDNIKRNIESAQDIVKNNYERDNSATNYLTEIFYDGYPLLFTHYSRFYPAKIGLIALGELKREQPDELIDLEKFRQKAFDIAEKTCKRLVEIEKDKNITRVNRVTTGLPKPFIEDIKSPEQVIYEERYKDKIFGRVRKAKESGLHFFDGLMSALELIRIFKITRGDKVEYKVTFSELGKNFYLDKLQFKEISINIFNDDEKQFIIKNLLSKRELELELIKITLDTIPKESDMLSEKEVIENLDEGFRKIINKYQKDKKNDTIFKEKLSNILVDNAIEAIRIATLGRMSELSLVKWEIVKGKSQYTRGDEKFASLISEITDVEIRQKMPQIR